MSDDGRMVFRDFLVFQLKLALDGIMDLVSINLSVIAVIVDLITKRQGESRLFYRVVRLSERFEHWLDLHRVKGQERLGPGSDRTTETPIGRVPGADQLIEELEELAKRKTGKDSPVHFPGRP